jgi:hypothetical protein
MDAYGAALPVLRLSGPTLFAPILSLNNFKFEGLTFPAM